MKRSRRPGLSAHWAQHGVRPVLILGEAVAGEGEVAGRVLHGQRRNDLDELVEREGGESRDAGHAVSEASLWTF